MISKGSSCDSRLQIEEITRGNHLVDKTAFCSVIFSGPVDWACV